MSILCTYIHWFLFQTCYEMSRYLEREPLSSNLSSSRGQWNQQTSSSSSSSSGSASEDDEGFSSMGTNESSSNLHRRHHHLGRSSTDEEDDEDEEDEGGNSSSEEQESRINMARKIQVQQLFCQPVWAQLHQILRSQLH